MPVPKGKVSKSRRSKRSANKNIAMGPVGKCQTCQAALGSHRVCDACGYYKGVKVMRTKAERAQARGNARAAAAQQQNAAPAESTGQSNA